MGESFQSRVSSSGLNSYIVKENIILVNNSWGQGNSFGQREGVINSLRDSYTVPDARAGYNGVDFWKSSLGQEGEDDLRYSNMAENNYQGGVVDLFQMELDRVDLRAQGQFKSKKQDNKNIDFIPASGEQLTSLFKPEISNSANVAHGVLQSTLFNVNHAKSIYSNKISRLVQRDMSPNTNVSLSPTQSKKQQKYQRKVSFKKEENSDFSSNELNSQIGQLSINNNDPQQIKLAKNRESARNSRNRKKIYVDLLETKLNEMALECNRLKDICRKYERTIQESQKNAQIIKQFMEGQQELYEKLERLVWDGKTPEIEQSEIALFLDALRFRTSTNSKERLTGTKQLINEIIDLSIPIHFRYLLKSMDVQRDLFSMENNYFEWTQQMITKMEPKREQLQKIVRLTPKFKQLKSNMEKVIEQVIEAVDKVHYEASKIEQFIDLLFKELQPWQTAQLLLCINQVDNMFIQEGIQNRFRKDFMTRSIFQSLHMISNDDGDGDGDEFQIDIEEHDIKYKKVDETKMEEEARKQIKLSSS